MERYQIIGFLIEGVGEVENDPDKNPELVLEPGLALLGFEGVLDLDLPVVL